MVPFLTHKQRSQGLMQKEDLIAVVWDFSREHNSCFISLSLMKERKYRTLTCSKRHKYFTLRSACRFGRDPWCLSEAGLTITGFSCESQLPSPLGWCVLCCHRTVPTAWTVPSAVTAATPTGATPPRATAAASRDGQVQHTPLGSTNQSFLPSGAWSCG